MLRTRNPLTLAGRICRQSVEPAFDDMHEVIDGGESRYSTHHSFKISVRRLYRPILR